MWFENRTQWLPNQDVGKQLVSLGDTTLDTAIVEQLPTGTNEIGLVTVANPAIAVVSNRAELGIRQFHTSVLAADEGLRLEPLVSELGPHIVAAGFEFDGFRYGVSVLDDATAHNAAGTLNKSLIKIVEMNLATGGVTELADPAETSGTLTTKSMFCAANGVAKKVVLSLGLSNKYYYIDTVAGTAVVMTDFIASPQKIIILDNGTVLGCDGTNWDSWTSGGGKVDRTGWPTLTGNVILGGSNICIPRTQNYPHVSTVPAAIGDSPSTTIWNSYNIQQAPQCWAYFPQINQFVGLAAGAPTWSGITDGFFVEQRIADDLSFIQDIKRGFPSWVYNAPSETGGPADSSSGTFHAAQRVGNYLVGLYSDAGSGGGIIFALHVLTGRMYNIRADELGFSGALTINPETTSAGPGDFDGCRAFLDLGSGSNAQVIASIKSQTTTIVNVPDLTGPAASVTSAPEICLKSPEIFVISDKNISVQPQLICDGRVFDAGSSISITANISKHIKIEYEGTLQFKVTNGVAVAANIRVFLRRQVS
jgi:hypothetical protein